MYKQAKIWFKKACGISVVISSSGSRTCASSDRACALKIEVWPRQDGLPTVIPSETLGRYSAKLASPAACAASAILLFLAH